MLGATVSIAVLFQNLLEVRQSQPATLAEAWQTEIQDEGKNHEHAHDSGSKSAIVVRIMKHTVCTASLEGKCARTKSLYLSAFANPVALLSPGRN